MTYLKHPEHGNMHVGPSEADKLVSQGWVIWPRSKDAKAGIVTCKLSPSEVQPDSAGFILPAIVTEVTAKRAYIRKAK